MASGQNGNGKIGLKVLVLLVCSLECIISHSFKLCFNLLQAWIVFCIRMCNQTIPVEMETLISKRGKIILHVWCWVKLFFVFCIYSFLEPWVMIWGIDLEYCRRGHVCLCVCACVHVCVCVCV